MRLFCSRVRKSKSPQSFRDRAAADIMRYAQGTPIVGYHDEEGNLVIPAEYDDEYKEN